MAVFVVRASAIGDQLTDELRVLLSRAYTDERHLATYAPADLERLREAIDLVHSGTATMPREWLRQFPTVRNLWHRADGRLDSRHFIDRRGQDLAGHLALFEQELVFDNTTRQIGGYIEDVATDPRYIRSGIATALLKMSMAHAEAAGYNVMALGSAIPEFYERLGWERWDGTASHERRDGSEGIDTQEMVFAVTPTGAEVVQRHRGGHLFRPAREHARS